MLLWIFPGDPGFEPKAGRVLDVYARRLNYRALLDDDGLPLRGGCFENGGYCAESEYGDRAA